MATYPPFNVYILFVLEHLQSYLAALVTGWPGFSVIISWPALYSKLRTSASTQVVRIFFSKRETLFCTEQNNVEPNLIKRIALEGTFPERSLPEFWIWPRQAQTRDLTTFSSKRSADAVFPNHSLHTLKFRQSGEGAVTQNCGSTGVILLHTPGTLDFQIIASGAYI